MKTPPTVWSYSQFTEIDRIINTAACIGTRFFQQNGFLVLPHLVKKHGEVVYFPNLKLTTREISQCAKLKLRIPMTQDKKIINLVVNKLHFIPISFSGLQNEWKIHEKEFWKLISYYFPKIKIKHLEIRPTIYGTLSSFDFKDNQVLIYIRIDVDVSHIAEAIISALLMKSTKQHDQWQNEDSWKNNETVVDYLMTQTMIADLFPNYQKTLRLIDKKDIEKLQKESAEYLASLGFASGSIFSVIDDNLLIRNKKVKDIFNPVELSIIKLLIKRKNTIVSYDEIANILWPINTEDKYSLWAIAKTIERIRQKLVQIKVAPRTLQSRRKFGYCLID